MQPIIRVAGIDIGSVSIAFVIMDETGRICHSIYRFHQGNIHACLRDILDSNNDKSVHACGVVSEKGREFLYSGIEVNEQIALVEGVAEIYLAAAGILTIGGETFGLIVFDQEGRYRKYISNSSCAAGTGSFLDQQASRLGLSGSHELDRLAAAYVAAPPHIATRCSVFAKTDLVHLQQQGYSLPAIAAGLCHGLAQNICDTLFQGIEVADPIAVVGGVSKNQSVVNALSLISGKQLVTVSKGELAGAIGAARVALQHCRKNKPGNPVELSGKTVCRNHQVKRHYGYPPLVARQTRSMQAGKTLNSYHKDVETELYAGMDRGFEIPCYLGIDIGSTSTKAVIMDLENNVLAGLYTRTGGQPISALQKLTRVIESIENEKHGHFNFVSTGTTGSGRKFIQKIARADYCIDEITAHARAAIHLKPDVDTIIEIGGQDSKFTVVSDGRVTFSVMNYVCAAGTGSFIEEQANRLGVAITDYAKLALGVPAPLISNRCTVFMERDLNHMLSLGYDKRELLAAALHAVRDNYLSKVAHRSKIGRNIAFQGATARNRALVSVFEYELDRPIYVSQFCHLTGAYGVCLKMSDMSKKHNSQFRKKIHDDTIAVGEYVCEYCSNHCKIKTINIEGETIGWGYLCGRDERDAGFKKRRAAGFDVLSRHRKIFDFPATNQPGSLEELGKWFQELNQGKIQTIIRRPGLSLARIKNRIQFNALKLRDDIFSSGIISRKIAENQEKTITIGLPNCLTMMEYLPLWNVFFKCLGFTTVTPASSTDTLASGKAIRGAEYCAPLTDFHGHIQNLSRCVDYVFYPQVMEINIEKESKAYCYYSQYAVPSVKNMLPKKMADNIIAPVLKFDDDIHRIIRSVFLSFPETIRRTVSFNKVETALTMSWEWFLERGNDLKRVFKDQFGATQDVSIALLGRPYLVLNPYLNKGIPDKLADLGVQTFFMDMIPVESSRLNAALSFLEHNHWHYGDIIIKTAEMIAQTDRLFPIYITAFKCSPDSFLISYFQSIMDYYNKPYLILQLDEHEAGEGYESRLEAALETFRGYQPSPKMDTRPVMEIKRSFEDKTYLLPNYDSIGAKLTQAAFLKAGLNALLIEQNEDIIKTSLHSNEGQCLPLNVISQGIYHTIKAHSLNPFQTALFINSDCNISCNLPQYPIMIKQRLMKMGEGMEAVSIMVSRFMMNDLPIGLTYDIYMGFVISGLLQRIIHKIRPRAKNPKQLDAVVTEAVEMMFRTIRDGESKEEAFKAVINSFLGVSRSGTILPQVGIVGDLYVRDNDVFNHHLIREIESLGGEAVTVPFADSIRLIVSKLFEDQWVSGKYVDFVINKVSYNAYSVFGNRLLQIAEPLLGNADIKLDKDPSVYLQQYFTTLAHGGETTENLLKIYYLKENYPNLVLILNVNPLFCCPGLISESIFKRLEKDISIPIVSITYDGTETSRNELLRPYLHYLTSKHNSVDK
ncbi:hypothetical protein JW979_08695 [bacterium]|nr:hypothetical protein [candidate division CSSED10-310 bacterium]